MKGKSGRTTIKDVAREAGVSTALVSIVINARIRNDGTLDCPVNPITAERIQSVVRRLNYRPNQAAASLRKGRRKTIGVICPDMARHYFAEISRNIENIAYENGYTVLFGSSDDSVQKLGDLVSTFIADGVEGMLITPCMDCHSHIQRTVDLGIPVVLMTRDLPGQENVGKVLLDNEKGIRLALSHLYSRGYRRIEMISNSSGLSNLTHREVLYMKEMELMGLGAYARISRVKDDNVDESMEILLEEAIGRGVEAVLYPGASLGRISFAAMRKMGRRIPDDLAIMSFDGGLEYTLLSPSITQIQQSRRATAEKAFLMLTGMIRGEEPRTILLDPIFTEGGSTACIHPERLHGELPVTDIRKMHRSDSVLLPAVFFDDKGGWHTERQFMNTMGSSYLMAHGLGSPVKDASTTVEIPCNGEYNILVRTMNWTAPWSDAPTPGTFRLLIDGQPAPTVLGNGKGVWAWQDAGRQYLEKGPHRISLHDLHGFDARVDSILFTLTDCIPEADAATVKQLRTKLLNLPRKRVRDGFDLVVAGAGPAGICAAVAAARSGLKVALVFDGEVPGGSNSSEVRAGLQGRINLGRFPSLGYLLNEFAPAAGGDALPADVYGDSRKLKFLSGTEGLSLFAGYHIGGVIMDGPSIRGVVATNATDYREVEMRGALFADCTGDGILGSLAGAETQGNRKDAVCGGASVRWYCQEGEAEESFPDIDWGLALDASTAQKVRSSTPEWNTGFAQDGIAEAERIRDYGMYVAYSNWSYLKNRAPFRNEYRRSKLMWMATVPYKTDGMRFTGGLVLTENDLLNQTRYPDGCVGVSWAMETVEAEPSNQHAFKEPWLVKRTKGPVATYDLPFRCLFSHNVPNLFLAGRTVSVSRRVLSTVGQLRTCALTGEVAGLAASVCRRKSCLPGDVFPAHWKDLEALMHKGAGRTDVPYTQVYGLKPE